MVFVAVPLSCFSLLVVAVGPSYFNNNQQVERVIAFGHQCLLQVVGWLWRFPQTDRAKTGGWSFACSEGPPPYL
jgi:hypothetical protein